MAANQPKPSISAHRLFPAVVALWFAALFGLGLIVLPSTAVERIVSASGMAAIIPAAAPPLGFTAHLLLALVAACGGALAGYFAAKMLAPRRPRSERKDRAQKDHIKTVPVQRRRMAPEAGRRPLSAMEDLGPPIIAPTSMPDDVAEVEVEEGPVAEDYWPEPEPDLAYEVRALPAELEVRADEFEPEYEYAEYEVTALPDAAPEPLPAVAPLPAVEPVPEAPGAPIPEAEPEFEPEPEPARGKLLHQATPARAVLPSDPAANLERMGTVQLAERLALAMQRHPGRPQGTPPAYFEELTRQLAEPEPTFGPAREPADAPSSLAAAAAAAPTPSAPAPEQAMAQPEQTAKVEPLAAAERILGRASVTSAQEPEDSLSVPPLPAPELQAFGEEEYDYEEEDYFVQSLPLAGLSPAEGPIEDEPIENEESWDSGDQPERYSSLLAMRQPLREPALGKEWAGDETAGADAEPVATEPAIPQQAVEMPTPRGDVRPFDAPGEDSVSRVHPDRAETERVLRSALESIQRLQNRRMSGAA
ncbi:hypothetical protein SZ64_14670 [Erythrobacter sp. SG61-1L]|uniref:hypothetical protein n=1 Tax=Erythrobacter sp. SG61-1L TaxID=1603897 RepID=UPI0006C90AE3|nr:hypothetical protein [Erythrobacter sp. SG61-1L]KPL69235.1 hypothetical protein SZ64_14670 [Erythrobacter sp. SG61-1L]